MFTDSRTLEPFSRCFARLTTPSPLPRSPPRLFLSAPYFLPSQVRYVYTVMPTPRTVVPPDSRTLRPIPRRFPRLTTPSPLPRSLPRFVYLSPLLPPQVRSTRVAMSTPRTALSTPRTATATPPPLVAPSPPLATSGSLCLPRGSLYLRRRLLKTFFASDNDHLYNDFLLIWSGFRFSCRSLLHWLIAIVALRPLASTLLTFRRVVNPASSNLIERQLSFSKFYKPRTGRLPSTK